MKENSENETVNITIDGLALKASPGEKILRVALENNIYIPNLCAVKENSRPDAGCRLCYVEVEGRDKPVTACTTEVQEDMAVKTRSPRIDRLVQTSFELLMSDHNLNCSQCPANKKCELQKIARERRLKLKPKRVKPLNRELETDESPATFTLDRSRCVRCGRCVWADQEVARIGAIGFSRRGLHRVISTFNDLKLAETPCTECGLCVEACPTGALFFKDQGGKSNYGEIAVETEAVDI